MLPVACVGIFDALLITYVGGLGTIIGPVIGAIFFIVVQDQLALNLPGLVPVAISGSPTPVFLLKDGIPAGFLRTPNLDPTKGELKRLQARMQALLEVHREPGDRN